MLAEGQTGRKLSRRKYAAANTNPPTSNLAVAVKHNTTTLRGSPRHVSLLSPFVDTSADTATNARMDSAAAENIRNSSKVYV